MYEYLIVLCCTSATDILLVSRQYSFRTVFRRRYFLIGSLLYNGQCLLAVYSGLYVGGQGAIRSYAGFLSFHPSPSPTSWPRILLVPVPSRESLGMSSCRCSCFLHCACTTQYTADFHLIFIGFLTDIAYSFFRV